METNTLALLLGGALVGVLAGYFLRLAQATRRKNSAEEQTKRRLAEAETEAKEIIVEAKDKAASLLVESKNEEKERKGQLLALENRLLQREEMLDKRLVSLDEEEKTVKQRTAELASAEAEVAELRNKTVGELERGGGLSGGGARGERFKQIREKNVQELAQLLQKLDKDRREEIEKKSMEIITIALQRFARSHVAEVTTSAFPLAGGEDLKGKIIGREGRNIRALERATGVEFVIDETPDSIIISSFDPYRREVARLALAKLVKDGRIQPAKIEEK